MILPGVPKNNVPAFANLDQYELYVNFNESPLIWKPKAKSDVQIYFIKILDNSRETLKSCNQILFKMKIALINY